MSDGFAASRGPGAARPRASLVLLALLLAAPALAGVARAPDGYTFTLAAPGARAVFLAGTFNDWSATALPMKRDEAGLWSVAAALASGEHRYKFVVDGVWKEDPENPRTVDDGYGGVNAVLVIAADGSIEMAGGGAMAGSARAGAAARVRPRADRGTVFLNLVWHQHQPSYLDPERDQLIGPWVRTHGTKDYYDMAALIGEFPEVHASINLTSSLLLQLDDYYVKRLGPFVDVERGKVDAAGFLKKWGGRTDPWVDLLLKDPAGYDATDLGRVAGGVWSCFSVAEPLIRRFPQYTALRGRKAAEMTPEERRHAVAFFYLANFDPDFLRGPVMLPDGKPTRVHALIREEPRDVFRLARPLTAADGELILCETYRILAGVVPAHKRLLFDSQARTGQIEVLTTPFYHPIVPLLIDSDVAAVCQPRDPRPDPAFRFPEDAGAQVARALAFYQRLFGRRPAGMWPSEGAVSEEAAALFARRGVRWIATGDGVLEASAPKGLTRYAMYRAGPAGGSDGAAGTGAPGGTGGAASHGGAEVAIVFRDTRLSDKIGFSYQKTEGTAAAEDFVSEILALAPHPQAPPRLVTVILDGENAWENYERDNDGKTFLRTLYRWLDELYGTREVVTVTGSEWLDGNPARGVPAHPPERLARIEKLWPAAWFGGSLATWIGEREENRAWDVLREVRAALGASSVKAPAADAPEPPRNDEKAWATWKAWDEIYAAEGSDWFWWYGSDQTAPGGADAIFDAAFRSHVANVYRYARMAGAALQTPEIPAIAGAAAPRPAGGDPEVQITFECDMKGRAVSQAVYIVGDQPSLGNWTPNRVRMFDDGTHGDAAAGDGVWSLTLSFPGGQSLEYKYTNSGQPGQWMPGEEFPVANRQLTVADQGGGTMRLRDTFGTQ